MFIAIFFVESYEGENVWVGSLLHHFFARKLSLFQGIVCIVIERNPRSVLLIEPPDDRFIQEKRQLLWE
jgi:hypothetical protein